MKILHVIFSTNRLKYLTKSLDSHSLIDYGDHFVDKLIIDDYPATRNNAVFDLLAKSNGCKLDLHQENLGLSLTWTQFFEYLKTTNYDYVLHQEDDVILTEKIKIDDLIAVLESDSSIASVVLKRQPWYHYEKEDALESEKTQFNQYKYTKNHQVFSIIFSFYKKSISEYPIKDYWKFNLNECMIMSYLNFFPKLYSVTLESADGKNLIEHIGEESIGKRVLEGEPDYEQFAHIDPDRFYSSRTGALID